MVVSCLNDERQKEMGEEEMKPRALAGALNMGQFRANATTRRKMASLRVSLQRRRLRRSAQLCPRDSALLIELSTESKPTEYGVRQRSPSEGEAQPE